MTRMNISVPDALAEEVRRRDIAISAVCQRALRDEVAGLQDIVDVLDGAIDYFQARYADCGDCRRSPDGIGRHCADHDEDQRLEHAARTLRAQYAQATRP